MIKRQILIDTDSGMDDIIALNMVASEKNISIKGIVTTRGLTNPSTGKNNFLKILKFLEKKIDVSAGSKSPLKSKRLKNVFPEQDIINSSELLFLGPYIGKGIRQKNNDKYLDFIYKKISGTGKTTILCLGPLTNIAKAVKKFGTALKSKIDRLIIMGGAVFNKGNVEPLMLAEYNFYLDPEAANFIFGSGINIVLIATDVTRFVPATDAIKKKISEKSPKTNEGKIIRKTIVSNNKDFRFFYDPLAASILIDSKIVLKSKMLGLKIKETGQSVPYSKFKNVKLITKVDANKFYKLLFQKLE